MTTDHTPTVPVDRLDRLDALDLRNVGDTLMRAYSDALDALRTAETEYQAWRTEMVRRKP